MTKPARIFYIDNMRVFLIALVALHHLAITYGGAGSWYYKETEGDTFTQFILAAFNATNQTFFMGFFFLLSAYFTKISFDRKPIKIFIKDRIVRLGIPLAVFYFALSPLTEYLGLKFGRGIDISLLEFISKYQGFGFGPLWFIETLIYFSIIYLIYKLIFKLKSVLTETLKFPKPLIIICFALLVSLITIFIRLWLPIGWEIPNLGLQIAFFPQYIFMLIFGLLFAKYNWFESISYKQGIKWFTFAQILIFIGFPLMFLLGMEDAGLESFIGGTSWQAISLALWEQLTGFSLMIGFVGIFKEKFNKQGKLAKQLSGGAYAVFVIHATVVVGVSVFFKDLELYPVLKFMLMAPIVLFFCFTIAILLKKVPGINKVL